MVFPTPTIPPGGSDDPALDPNWDGGPDNCGNYVNGQTAAQIILKQLEYINNHPGSTQGYVALVDTVMALSEKGLMNGSTAEQYLQQAMANDPSASGLLRDAIDQCASYAFLNGYGGAAGGTLAAYQNYLAALQSAFGGIAHSNAFITDMQDEVAHLSSTDVETQFMESHSAGYNGAALPAADAFGNKIDAGDIIWTSQLNGTTIYYDWTKAQQAWNGTTPSGSTNDLTKDQAKAELDLINDTVGGSSGPTGSSATNPDLMALQFSLKAIQTSNALNTLNEVLKLSGGNVGLAILALLYSMEGDQMGNLSSNADVMDKQSGLTQDAKAIEDYLKTLASGGGNPGNFRGYILTLFSQIENSSQFSGSLSDAVNSAINTLNGTEITYPPSADPKAPTRSVWSLLTDPTVTNDQLGKAFNAYFNPAIPTDPSDPAPNSPVQQLQSLLGGVDGIVTAVSSASSQATTVASQLESLIQAIVKPMTGVIDPNNGLMAINKTAINAQRAG